MKIVTAGSTYLDIDAYAGCVAYAELLREQGVDAKAISMAKPNASVPNDYIDALDIDIENNYTPEADDTFILVDISDPKYFDDMVVETRIEEIYDHHFGFEEYWKDKIGDKAKIEFVGAACTLIFEAWRNAGLLQDMKPHTAKLLCAGILDNTLNFKAVITSERDRVAYVSLQKIGNLDTTFAEEYFEKCELSMDSNIMTAIENDRKDFRFKQADFDTTILQMAVWSGQKFIAKYEDAIREYGNSTGNEWFVNVLSVGDGCSYFMADSPKVQELLSKLFGIEFIGNVGKAPRLWLRKEMIKHASSSGAKI